MPHHTVGIPVEEDVILGRLDALRGQPHVCDAYVDFRIAILEAQRAVRRALQAADGGRPASARLRAEPADAPPTPETVVFDGERLRGLVSAIVAAVGTRGSESDDLRRLADAALAEPECLRDLARAAAFGPDQPALEALARRRGISPDVLCFVGRTIAAPFIAEAVAGRLAGGGPSPAEGEPHRCPACGSPPSLARLRRADGRRLLICGLCGSDWEAGRLGCACCGTREGGLLGVLRLADADARWIETCDSCQGYIKTVDERRLAGDETFFPVVEEAATLHLDLLAEREGYVRRVPYVLSG